HWTLDRLPMAGCDWWTKNSQWRHHFSWVACATLQPRSSGPSGPARGPVTDSSHRGAQHAGAAPCFKRQHELASVLAGRLSLVLLFYASAACPDATRPSPNSALCLAV